MTLSINSILSHLRYTEILSPQFLALFFLCMGLGVLHALGPGHGKSLLLASLVGESKSVKNALKISLVMGVTHVSDVLILGFLSLFFVSFIPESSIRFSLEAASGAGILLIGVYRLFKVFLDRNNRTHSHDHSHTHGHNEHTNNHVRATMWSAFFYSLAPCPAAWIIFLTTLGLHKALLGFFLIVGLSLGVQLTVTTLALAIVYSADAVEKKFGSATLKWVPVFSSIVTILIGGVILKDALRHEPHR